jgi:hypothetical protein
MQARSRTHLPPRHPSSGACRLGAWRVRGEHAAIAQQRPDDIDQAAGQRDQRPRPAVPVRRALHPIVLVPRSHASELESGTALAETRMSCQVAAPAGCDTTSAATPTAAATATLRTRRSCMIDSLPGLSPGRTANAGARFDRSACSTALTRDRRGSGRSLPRNRLNRCTAGTFDFRFRGVGVTMRRAGRHCSGAARALTL